MDAREIRNLFAKFGAEIGQNDIWQVQSATVIKHKALERLAAAAKIAFLPPQILRSERDEAVILVTGSLDDRTEWSIGEALINANYRITGKMAPYPYAMAEKRAKDRVILKLAGLHGIYSEDEADEFKDNRAAANSAPSQEFTMAIEAMRKQQTRLALRDWYAVQKDVLREIFSEAERSQFVDEYTAYGRSLPEEERQAA